VATTSLTLHFDIYILIFISYKRCQPSFDFVAYLDQALPRGMPLGTGIFTGGQIQFCPGAEFYHSEFFTAS